MLYKLSRGILLLSCITAYDQDGHEAIGMTVMSAVKHGKVYTQLKKLLKGKDAVDV